MLIKIEIKNEKPLYIKNKYITGIDTNRNMIYFNEKSCLDVARNVTNISEILAILKNK